MARYNNAVQCCTVLVKGDQMTNPKTPKTPKTPVAPAANPFAALLAAPVAPGATAKVHVLATGAGPVQCANHVATLKGNRGLHAAIAACTYTLGAKAYSPKAGTANAVQWAAVQAVLVNGPATGAAIAAQFTSRGLQAGHAGQFIPYACKAGWLALA
jgi:hypothetical protein